MILTLPQHQRKGLAKIKTGQLHVSDLLQETHSCWLSDISMILSKWGHSLSLIWIQCPNLAGGWSCILDWQSPQNQMKWVKHRYSKENWSIIWKKRGRGRTEVYYRILKKEAVLDRTSFRIEDVINLTCFAWCLAHNGYLINICC